MSKKGDKKDNGTKKENGKAGKLASRELAASKSTVEMSKKDYDETLYRLQIELVKLQRHLIKSDDKIVVIFEGRDAAGKDGTIKRITEHLSPRETRVVALGKPSDRDRGSWYFQRYIQYLPAAQELVLFNRSWYNRAGVERVMGFCTGDEYEEFMNSVLEFEHMLIRSGLKLLKYYLDISKAEQEKRLEDRKKDPLAQWKISALDEYALKKWDEYSLARDKMLVHTHNLITPWIVVHADDKPLARINLIKDMLSRLEYEDKEERLILPDPQIVATFEASFIEEGLLAR
jgi:polyphosphate kinase 2